MKKKIHLIRHGITEGNLKRWHYGWADIPLAKEGVENLKKLKEENIYPRPEKALYYTSGMLRTEQTFEIIYGNHEHKVAEKLKEMNFGEFEAKTYEEVKDDERYARWTEDKSGSVALPGGESKLGFFERVSEGFDELAEIGENGDNLICVCHGGVIACIMMKLFAKDMGEFRKWIPDPGRGYSIISENGRFVSFERI